MLFVKNTQIYINVNYILYTELFSKLLKINKFDIKNIINELFLGLEKYKITLFKVFINNTKNYMKFYNKNIESTYYKNIKI